MKRHIRETFPAATDRLVNWIDRMRSASLDISECESVCLALGPYRNLTTLTASILFLHPHCQVLNHGGARIYGNPRLNFLLHYDRKRFDRFLRYAIQISGKGQPGDSGGSITFSHAFDARYGMKETYSQSGSGLIKARIKCLFWKESLRTSNLIREHRIDLDEILEREPRLRFMMPVRNPLDCAKSNLSTGHVDLFRNVDATSPINDVVEAVLEEIHWFALQQERHPDRFFHYFEHGIDRGMLVDLATFLDLDPDDTWISRALPLMVSQSKYEHDQALVESYREMVAGKFSNRGAWSEGLLRFV